MSESVTVSEKAKQTESTPTGWAWVDRNVWTERMLAGQMRTSQTLGCSP